MIPSGRNLKSRLNKDIFLYNLFEDDYFESAEEFIRLNKIFNPEGLIEKVSLWIDMIISPLITIITAIVYQESPGLFSALGFHKTITYWMDWISYHNLKKRIHEWTSIVQSIGGPFISTNDPVYHAYVYADGMQRIRYSFFPKN